MQQSRVTVVDRATLRTSADSASLGSRLGKRAFDIGLAISLAPVLVFFCIALIVLNRVYNPGALLIWQKRMGRHGAPFLMLKFRTMLETSSGGRGPEDPLEVERITPLGHWLRHFRIDEIPQIINVLQGDMSFIGPRPDLWEHAVHFCAVVPGYARRHAVLPGITGLAQVGHGYAAGADETSRKARIDAEYIDNASILLDCKIALATVAVMLRGRGAA